jgi:thiol-disulfide isomerase/thioredoxin
MDKKLAGIVVVVILLLGAGIVYLLVNQTPMTPEANEQTNSQTSSPTTTPEQPPATPGAYKDYTESSIASTSGTKVIFFHAPWCPQCRQLDTEIKAGTLPSGVTIFKADYDTNQALRQKYGVSLQTTFVRVDDQGNLVKKYVAYDEPTLAALTKSGVW